MGSETRFPEEALAGAMHELTFSLHAEIPAAKEDELKGLQVGQSATVELPDGATATVTRKDELGYVVETSGPEDEHEEERMAA